MYTQKKLPGTSFLQISVKEWGLQMIIEKLTNKLAGWKQNSLSMAGRTILIKLVAQDIPCYIMQSFLIPKSILTKMDTMIRDFFWGFKGSQQHHLYLKSWNSICTPKQNGGLGIRKTTNINIWLMTKLAWKVMTSDGKILIQLIKGKYLWGRSILDTRMLKSLGSWVWSGIRNSLQILNEGNYYKIGEKSNISIRGKPWLPKAAGFRIPYSVIIPPQF